MLQKTDNRGLIKLLLLILIGVIILGYFKIDLRSIVESEPVQKNLNYVWEILTYIWENIIIGLIWNNFRELINRFGANLT